MNRDFSELSNRIIGAAIEVHKNLGPGLLESTYQKCLSREFKINNIEYKAEYPLPVLYKGVFLECGYRIDFFVENSIVLELKSVEQIKGIHMAQILTYMKLAKVSHGLLINFNVKLLKQGLRSFVL